MRLSLSLEADMPSLVQYLGHLWVPETAKAKVLQKVQLYHVRENKTLALARGLYFWPGMVKDIKKFVWSCPECEQNWVPKPLTLGTSSVWTSPNMEENTLWL